MFPLAAAARPRHSLACRSKARTPPHNDAIECVSRAAEIKKYLGRRPVDQVTLIDHQLDRSLGSRDDSLMSASDAAPLPRLGEVFFDVRGESRTMRLSWYADTDVAVFSIWQGGKCTGTFRLPMDDLGRMIEILRRGPDRRSGRGAVERGPRPSVANEAAYGGDNTVIHAAEAQNRAGQHGTGDFSSRDFGPPGDHGPGDYGPGDYGPGDYGPGDYGPRDYGDAGYRDRESRPARHRSERYEPDDYGPPGYAEEPSRREYWQDGDYADRTGQRFGPADEPGYGQERFAQPYGRPQPDSSEPGFMDDSEYRLPADPAGRSRHSVGRHSGGQGQ
jgi:hypothetical protein